MCECVFVREIVYVCVRVYVSEFVCVCECECRYAWYLIHTPHDYYQSQPPSCTN